MTSATPNERFDLITRRLQEVLGGDSIKAILAEGGSPKGYWGAYILLGVFSFLI
jgi:tyrosyl-tRNA synthetase